MKEKIKKCKKCHKFPFSHRIYNISWLISQIDYWVKRLETE